MKLSSLVVMRYKRHIDGLEEENTEARSIVENGSKKILEVLVNLN